MDIGGIMQRKRKEPVDVYQIKGYEVIIKSVSRAGTSGKVYLPISWVGKKVKVVRIE